MVEKFVKEIPHKQLRSLRCSSSDSRNLLLKMFVAASDLQRGGHCSGRNGRNITRFLVGSTVFPAEPLEREKAERDIEIIMRRFWRPADAKFPKRTEVT